MVFETGNEGAATPLRLVQPVLICHLANFRILPRTSLMKQRHTRQSPIHAPASRLPTGPTVQTRVVISGRPKHPFTTTPLHHICMDGHCVEGKCGPAVPAIDYPRCCPTTTAVGVSADSVFLRLSNQSLCVETDELDVTRGRGMSSRVW